MRRRVPYRYLRLTFYKRGALGARLEETCFSRNYECVNSTPLVALTSNTAPAPYVVNATTDSANAYRAFDNTANEWGIGNSGAESITIDLGPDKKRWRVPEFVKMQHSASGREPSTVALYGSHDGKMYTFLGFQDKRAFDTGGNALYRMLYENSQPSILYSMMYTARVPEQKKGNFFPYFMQMGDL